MNRVCFVSVAGLLCSAWSAVAASPSFEITVAAGPSAGLPSVLAVSLPAAAPTLYARTGDWFLVICLAWVATGVGGVRVRRVTGPHGGYRRRHSSANASRPVNAEPT